MVVKDEHCSWAKHFTNLFNWDKWTENSICSANQLTGFYMTATLALNGLIEVLFRNIYQIIGIYNALYAWKKLRVAILC